MATAYSDEDVMHDDNLETFGLLWLDAAVHTSEENREAQQEIRSSINHVTTFETSNSCQKYIRSVPPHDRLVLIVSGRLGEEVVPYIHQIRQVSSIYVYCMDKSKHEKWAKNFQKVKAVAVKLDNLIFKIKSDQKKRVKTEDPIVINIFAANSNPEQSTTGLNGQFLHSLLLIDVLLRMKSVKTDKQELIDLCKKQYKGNKTQLDILREFEKDYSAENSLRWYSRESFLYKMLNKALRVQNIDMLLLFRFFIRDIHRELERNQCQSSTRVYRGQVLSTEELKTLRESVGDFISVNSFFSTTLNRYKAMEFLNDSDVSNDLHRVLFEIDADPRVVTTKPFADITSFSEYSSELEILFMIGTIFRLNKIGKNSDQIWIVRLTLCGDNEHDLNTLFAHMKKAYGGGENATSLLHFGRVLRRMGQYDSAEKFYRRLLNEVSADDPLLPRLYYSLGLVLKDKKELDSSLEYLHRSLDIELLVVPVNYKYVADHYNAIGNTYRLKKDYDTALSWYDRGMRIICKEDIANHIQIAHFYNNMAIVYKEQRKYTDALHFNEKALSIREQNLPPNHPDIGLLHNNIGNIHRCLDDYDRALKHYHKALDIRMKSLPSNHPQLAESYYNISLAYEDENEPKKALEYFQKAANIRRQILPVHHPDLVKIEKDIERVSSKLN